MVSRLRYGNTNTFFIRGAKGNLLIDTDYAGTLPLFFKEIKKHNIDVRDITYILATHYHPDHMGIISELMKYGIRLLLIDAQTEYVNFSDSIFSRDSRLKYEPIKTDNAVCISCEESRQFLGDMGIDGEIIQTVSHSKDSISVMLDSGICFVGDLEPIEYLAAYDDNTALKEDWERVMSYDPKVIYYSHANEKIM
ncbi:MAG: MBL fold metallo-hydrolase [Oscillospiraceae bacterium]|nr:MBL fold metallo-hydrolase [Oscillospiraceae bacterium]